MNKYKSLAEIAAQPVYSENVLAPIRIVAQAVDEAQALGALAAACERMGCDAVR